MGRSPLGRGQARAGCFPCGQGLQTVDYGMSLANRGLRTLGTQLLPGAVSGHTGIYDLDKLLDQLRTPGSLYPTVTVGGMKVLSVVTYSAHSDILRGSHFTLMGRGLCWHRCGQMRVPRSL